ncbi:helix-turn-helix domain-containing protein [Mucilaginibacter rivuli]|uniref:helix-turn-helix domain-containing protein n=1 Tax=Mucilaginibacter rivuli TaxID=2857527 RepID=UPI0021024ADA|nr:AraC family transcriptional regulator [Mucilaginibacter rivuli]
MNVEAGRVEIFEEMSVKQLELFKLALKEADLELVDNRKNILIDKIINVICEMINHSEVVIKTNFSYHLSKKLNLDYTYMANVFSETQGITIEQFIIQNRIQKVKQLICHNDLNLTEISWQLHFSSVAHLSTQFKKVTGITPSQYKHIDCNKPLRP